MGDSPQPNILDTNPLPVAGAALNARRTRPRDHWYTRQVRLLTARDDDVYKRFVNVINLLECPSTLFHAKVLGEVGRPEHVPRRSGFPL